MCVLTYVALPDSARAAGFALYEWSARGNAMGGAVIASQKQGASCIASNPAGMTRIPGTQLEAGFTIINPQGDVEFENGESDHVTSHAFFDPNMFVTQQINDDWWFGVGEFTRFGLGTQYDEGWAGRGNMYKAVLETFSFNPNVAYKVNDELSVAAGIEYVYGSMDLRKDNRAINAALNEWILKPKGDAWGWDVAAHYVPTDWLSFGAMYRSSLRFFGTGSGEFTRSAGDDEMKMRATFPSSISTGMAIKATDDLTFEVDYIYTMWSEFRKMTYLFTDKTKTALADVTDKTMDSIKDYNDAMRIQFGVEWQAWDDVFLRAGYVFDESPQDKDYADYMLPSNDRQIVSTGLGLVFDKVSVDFSLMYLFASSREIDNNVRGTFDSNIENSKAYMGSMSVSYSF
ncbi:MAG: OmpP1/FadL family transporter [Desulfovibrionaceae bacterium]